MTTAVKNSKMIPHVPVTIDFQKAFDEQRKEIIASTTEAKLKELRKRPSFMFVHPYIYGLFFDERNVNPMAAIGLIMEFCKDTNQAPNEFLSLLQFLWAKQANYTRRI